MTKKDAYLFIQNFLIVLFTIVGCLYLYSPLNKDNENGPTTNSTFVYQQF
jgi:hypothetical protein